MTLFHYMIEIYLIKGTVLQFSLTAALFPKVFTTYTEQQEQPPISYRKSNACAQVLNSDMCIKQEE